MPMPVISIGGPPGSGTTTAARSLRDRLGLRYVCAGEFFRKMAAGKGMSLADFGRFVAKNPHIDRDIEMMQVEEARKGDVILEGRVTGFMLHSEGVDSFRAWITASEEERAKRVSDREGSDVEGTMARNLERAENEATRYMSTYGFDITDHSIYHAVIDNTELQASDVAERLIREFMKMYPDFTPKKPGGDGR